MCPLDHLIIKEDEDQFKYCEKLIKNRVYSHCASISLGVHSAIKEEMGN
jgi:hypothetical protein